MDDGDRARRDADGDVGEGGRSSCSLVELELQRGDQSLLLNSQLAMPMRRLFSNVQVPVSSLSYAASVGECTRTHTHTERRGRKHTASVRNEHNTQLRQRNVRGATHRPRVPLSSVFRRIGAARLEPKPRWPLLLLLLNGVVGLRGVAGNGLMVAEDRALSVLELVTELKRELGSFLVMIHRAQGSAER